MEIKSVFENNGKIPVKYTCDGEGVSPPLEITGIPESTRSLVLIVDDPDAPRGVFNHFIVWNIVAKGSIKIGEGEKVGTQGMNDAGKLGYLGPCPPSGTHRYYFRVYALDIDMDLEEGSIRESLEDEIIGHFIDSAQLIGIYSRDFAKL